MGRRQTPTLSVFIKALEGAKVALELRRDTLVRGTLASVDDGTLNIVLTDATVKMLTGEQCKAEILHIRGSAVRFIHLPGNLDPATAVEAHRKRIVQARRDHASRLGGATPALVKGQQFEQLQK